jgi:hypothetical protein
MTVLRQKHAGLTKVNNATLTPWIDDAFKQYPVLQNWFNGLTTLRKRKPSVQKTPAALLATNEKKKKLMESLNSHEHNSFLRVLW